MYIEGTIKVGTIAEFVCQYAYLACSFIGWVSSMVQEAEALKKRLNES
jgi:hypothetical protein